MIRALLIWAAVVLAATPLSAEALRIHASNGPLAYFAQRLAADAEVTMPVPHGTDPESWRPGIADITAMQEADLILLNGAELYGWVQRVSLPRARVVDTIRGLPAGSLIEIEGVTHAHAGEAEHTHAAVATKTWLDFRLAALQAAVIADAIVRLRPEQAAAVRERLLAVEAELARLDAEAAALGALLQDELVLASHRGYEYLAARAGFELKTLDWDPAVAAGPTALAHLDAILAQRPSQIMLFPEPPQQRTDNALRERDVAVVVFDTAASAPPRDVPDLLAAGLARLRETAAR